MLLFSYKRECNGLISTNLDNLIVIDHRNNRMCVIDYNMKILQEIKHTFTRIVYFSINKNNVLCIIGENYNNIGDFVDYSIVKYIYDNNKFIYSNTYEYYYLRNIKNMCGPNKAWINYDNQLVATYIDKLFLFNDNDKNELKIIDINKSAYDLVIQSNNNICVLCYRCVKIYDYNGKYLHKIKLPRLNSCCNINISIDNDDNLYLLGYGNGIEIYNKNYEYIFSISLYNLGYYSVYQCLGINSRKDIILSDFWKIYFHDNQEDDC